MRRLAPMFLAVLLLAGCSSPADPVVEEDDTPQYEDDRGLVVDQPTLPTAPPAPGERTLDAAPEWRLGEWWKIRLTSTFDGEVQEFHRVVAGTEHGNYLVGFPIDAFNNMAMVMHHPAFGDINKTTLSYDTHDAPFQHLQFPLRAGDSWTTTWQSVNSSVTVTVDSIDEAAGRATLVVSGAQSGTIVYDAENGDAIEMDFSGYGKVEVLEHGYNWTGAVRVPHDHDLVFFHGRLGPASAIGWSGAPLFGPVGQPMAPEETIQIEDTYDRVSFAIILIDVAALTAQAPAATGYYQQTATAPDGTAYDLTLTPADLAPIKIGFFEHADPGGSWQLTSIGGGGGQLLFEGIGYHSIDIELPSGCVRASGNAMHHVSLCKA